MKVAHHWPSLRVYRQSSLMWPLALYLSTPTAFSRLASTEMSNVKRISIISPIVSVRSSISLMRSVKAMVPSFVRSQDEETDGVSVMRRGRHHGASCVGDVPFPLGSGVTSLTTGNIQSIDVT